MGERHWCEPPRKPESLDDEWACPECGRLNRAFDPRSKYPADHVVVRHLPPGALGWVTSGAGGLSDAGGRVEP